MTICAFIGGINNMNEKEFNRKIITVGKLYIREEMEKLNNSFSKQVKIKIPLAFQVKMWLLFKKAVAKEIIFDFLN